MKIPYDHRLRIKVQPLVDMFCEYNLITPSTIDNKTRQREIVQSRQMVMYYIGKYTKLSNMAIGSIFNQDHATYLHAKSTISNLIDTDLKLKSYNKKNSKKIKKMIKEIFSPIINFYSKELENRLKQLEIELFHNCK